MNRRVTRSATVLAAALLITGGAVAPAGAAEDCGLADLALATSNAVSQDAFKNASDGEKLRVKVENASAKFAQKKYSDSEAKIWDYYNKVDALTNRNKMIQAFGTALLEDAMDVIACLKTYQ